MNPKEPAMSKLARPVVLFIAVVGLSGCTSQLLSDARIADNTAGILGVAPSDVAISGRREAFPNTYYTATVRGVAHACTINGGTALSFGMVNVPSCDGRGDHPLMGRSVGRQAGL